MLVMRPEILQETLIIGKKQVSSLLGQVYDSAGKAGCINFTFKSGVHGEDFAVQSPTNETFFSKILTVCGQFLPRDCSFVAMRKISSMSNNCHE